MLFKGNVWTKYSGSASWQTYCKPVTPNSSNYFVKMGFYKIGQARDALDVTRAHCQSFNPMLTTGCLDIVAIGLVVRHTSILTTCTQSLWTEEVLATHLCRPSPPCSSCFNRVSHPAIQRILALNRKAIEDMEKRLNHLRKGWVEEKEQSIIFGNGKDWTDVEADEATFSSTDLKQLADNPEQPIIWEQWCGIVQRGSPHTLLLKRLSPQTSARRAPGPGAIRKMEWRPLATKHLQDRAIVLHTDAAKSYKLKVSGVLHDQVRHCKKRVKVKGKWVWRMPTYVKIATHKDPKTGRQFKTKGGTQIIDRAWRFLKDRIQLNQHCRVGSPLLRLKIRSAQYEYWHRNSDLWTASGILCTWHFAK